MIVDFTTGAEEELLEGVDLDGLNLEEEGDGFFCRGEVTLGEYLVVIGFFVEGAG